MLETIRINKLYDMHVHLRVGEMLRNVAPLTARQCAYGLIMPNTVPDAILTGPQAQAYLAEIEAATQGMDFTPLMTVKIDPNTTPEMVWQASRLGVRAGKIYPDGVTTGSIGGVTDFDALWPVFNTMETVSMVLCLHGELPGEDVFCLDRETAFLPILERIAKAFPKLRIVLEHVSTVAAVEAVKRLPENVRATITAHHLFLTLNDVLEHGVTAKLAPHNFCKPVAKRPEDRAALREVALSGNAKFFLGSDSAPHPRDQKEAAEGCAGVFTAPVLAPLLVGLFDRESGSGELKRFSCENAAMFYELPYSNPPTLRLERRPWTVPPQYGNVVPLGAGEELAWQIVE